jgi:chromosome segregation ATPase
MFSDVRVPHPYNVQDFKNTLQAAIDKNKEELQAAIDKNKKELQYATKKHQEQLDSFEHYRTKYWNMYTNAEKERARLQSENEELCKKNKTLQSENAELQSDYATLCVAASLHIIADAAPADPAPAVVAAAGAPP